MSDAIAQPRLVGEVGVGNVQLEQPEADALDELLGGAARVDASQAAGRRETLLALAGARASR